VQPTSATAVTEWLALTKQTSTPERDRRRRGEGRRLRGRGQRQGRGLVHDPDEVTGDLAARHASWAPRMLAGRLYRRRNNPAGLADFAAEGGPVFVQRNDPDIAMLLRIGAYTPPRVG
jgi:hypothetical protein